MNPNPDIAMGVDLGKVRDPSAIVVVEGYWHRVDTQPGEPATVYRNGRPETVVPRIGGRLVPAYHVTHIERLDLGTPYPVVVDRVLDVGSNVGAYFCILDATGVGQAVVDMFTAEQRRRDNHWPRVDPFTLTGGEHGGDRSISKVDLTGAIKRQTSSGALVIDPPDQPNAAKLIQELQDFEVRINQRGHDRYGSATESAHDDLVIALGLGIMAVTVNGRRKPSQSNDRIIEVEP